MRSDGDHVLESSGRGVTGRAVFAARGRLAIAMIVGMVVVGAGPVHEAAAAGAVSFVGATSTARATATGSVRLRKPAGAEVGDVLLANFTVNHAPTISARPVGWTSLLRGRLRAGRSSRLFAFYHVVTARDDQRTGWTWTLSSRQAWSGGMARYVGVDPNRPIDTSVSVASSGSARSARVTVPGVTTTTSGTMLIGGVGGNAGRSGIRQPAGWREAWEAARGKAAEHAYRRQRDAGATGGRTWTVSSPRALAGWMTALRPAQGSPPATAPRASFTVSPADGTAPLSVSFTDTSTGAPTSWRWDFGDGTTSAVQNPAHTYTSAGTYTVSLRAANGAGSDTAIRTGAVTVREAPAAGDQVLVGAGDIADCSLTADGATAALVNATPGTVFTLGDNAYENGSTSDFANCYDPTWGAAKARTRPAAGNHEYNTTNAAPYFSYFGAAAGDPAKGWYSYDIGSSWHVVVLNSNCSFVGGCGVGSPQEQWLRADLAASTRACTVAMWHHPRFSSGAYGNDSITSAFWQDLYQDGAELVLNGHEHDYERFAPQNASGAADSAHGVREFVVGTGGKDLRKFGSTVAANSELHSASSHGVLKLTLHASGYDWSFLPIPGDSLTDSGAGSCHGAPS